MRAPWVPFAFLAVLLMLCVSASVVMGEGGVDPALPDGLYGDDDPHPVVEFGNQTFEENGTYGLPIDITMAAFDGPESVIITLEIYRWAVFGEERTLSSLAGPLPEFLDHSNDSQDGREQRWLGQADVGESPVTIGPQVVVPAGAVHGYYRVRVTLNWDGILHAGSMGSFTPEEWSANIQRVRDGDQPNDMDFLVSEGGFSIVPRDFDYVRSPNRVPDLGNFSTPVIRPGESGKYGFRVTNRYDAPMTGVRITIEFYMWATIEDAKDIGDIEGPAPKVQGEGAPAVTKDLGDIPVGGSVPVDIVITTSEDTDKGTYFVRHRIEFGYGQERFNMSSRGYFTFEQWEGFDYSNLYYQLGVAGIVPDSSFSVKDPVPLWPLATLIALCVLFGVLAVVFYLAEEHGDQYPRLKRRLQVLTGRWEERKRVLQQRVEELRGEDWEEGDEEREEEPGEEEPGDEPGS
jgi:hypothetical protein